MSENEKLEQSAPKKDKKPAKAKAPGFFSRIGRWVHEMKIELKKVQWPSKHQTLNNTLIVIACVCIVGAFIWAFDFVATNAIQFLISAFK